MTLYSLSRLYNTGMFQGHRKRDKYFEGWYYKLVDRDEKNVIAIIPGVSIVGDRYRSHSFIQIIDGKSCETDYIDYTLDEFKYSKDMFYIKVGASIFSYNRLIVDAAREGKEIRGDLKFQGLRPWPSKIFSPGSMGWYTFVPFMECNHGILSMDHSISGSLTINGRNIDFTGGRGYIEKDWGESFPRAWIWFQSNHFDIEGISIVFSIAKIPWLGNCFTGFMGGFLFDGRIYRFATYTGAKIKYIIDREKSILICVSDKKYIISMEIDKSSTGALTSPSSGLMTGKVDESITARVKIAFYRLSGGSAELIFEGTGRNAGLEIMGDLSELACGIN